jgi:hypothetical protein
VEIQSRLSALTSASLISAPTSLPSSPSQANTHIEQHIQTPILVLDGLKHALHLLVGADVGGQDLNGGGCAAELGRLLELLPPPADEREDQRLGVGWAGKGVREADGGRATDTFLSVGVGVDLDLPAEAPVMTMTRWRDIVVD